MAGRFNDNDNNDDDDDDDDNNRELYSVRLKAKLVVASVVCPNCNDVFSVVVTE